MEEIISNLKFTNERLAILLPLILIAIDVLTGVINAWVKGKLDSSVMRKGIGHKFAECVFIAVGILLDVFFGLHSIYIGLIIYISLMEIISIAENCAKLGFIPKCLKNKLNIKEGDTNEERNWRI